MRLDKGRIRAGMTARSTKGEKLGKIIHADEERFVVEKGAFFPKDYQLYYEFVTELRGDEVIYALEDARVGRDGPAAASERRRGDLRESTAERVRAAGGGPGIAGAGASAAAAVVSKVKEAKAEVGARLGGRSTGEAPGERLLGQEELRIPLMDEEIAIEKVARAAGHVRIHKEVRLEERHVAVPVRREEVVIERLPGGEATGSPIGANAFREQTVDVPVSEEEIRVTKRPVVREELRVRRVSHEEQRDAAATLRHEEVEIEDTTPAGRKLADEDAAALAAAGREGADFRKV